MNINSPVSTARLFAAADSLLAALQTSKGSNATVPMAVSKLSASQAALTSAFTPEELIDAMDMLIRMGFATARK